MQFKEGIKPVMVLKKEYGVSRDDHGCHVSGSAPTNRETAPTVFYYTMPAGPLNNPSFNFSYKITATFANGTSETLN